MKPVVSNINHDGWNGYCQRAMPILECDRCIHKGYNDFQKTSLAHGGKPTTEQNRETKRKHRSVHQLACLHLHLQLHGDLCLEIIYTLEVP